MATNLWEKFKGLLPDSPRQVVTVSLHNSDGTSTVTTASGGTMRVMGTDVVVGALAYVQGGVMLGAAPAIQHFDIEI